MLKAWLPLRLMVHQGPIVKPKKWSDTLSTQKKLQNHINDGDIKAFYQFKSWDKHRIPKPFTSMHIYFSEPLDIPLDQKQEHQYLTRELNKFQDKIDNIHNGCTEEAVEDSSH